MSALIEESPLPSRHTVRTLIEDLVNRPVDLYDADIIPARPTNVVAVYVTDRLKTSAVIVVDVAGAARLGGALGMLPKPVVEESIALQTLDEMLEDCCYEVLNVLASAFNTPEAPHVRLYQMYRPEENLTPDLAQLASAPGGRLDTRLVIGGYGEALVSVVVR
jgi:hypothetical protein